MPALPGETTRERTFAAFCRAHLEPLRGLPGARYGGAESPGRPSREHVGPGKADTAPKAPRAPEAALAARLALGLMTPGPPCLSGEAPETPGPPARQPVPQIVRRSRPAGAAAVSVGCR